MDLGAPPLQGPAAIVTQGAGRNVVPGSNAAPRQLADISANCMVMGGDGNDGDEDDELVAEIKLDGDDGGSGEDGGGDGAE